MFLEALELLRAAGLRWELRPRFLWPAFLGMTWLRGYVCFDHSLSSVGEGHLESLLFYVIFLLFRATLTAYGGSQAWGQIGAKAASLRHSHSAALPDLSRIFYLHHNSRQGQILNPPSEARDQTHLLMDASRICFCCATTGTPQIRYYGIINWSHCDLLYKWKPVAFTTCTRFSHHPHPASGNHGSVLCTCDFVGVLLICF